MSNKHEPDTRDNDVGPGPSKRRPSSSASTSWGEAGLALMIPSMMLAGPIAGYGVGYLLQRWLGWERWIIVVMVLLGLVAGIRESIVIMKKISHSQR